MEPVKTIIRPASGINLHLRELWQYRELLYFFAWRDIKVKYKQTFLGIAWALLQPLGMMLIFVLLFSRSSLAQTPGDLPYPLFVLSGLVLWNFFYTAVSQASESMITNANIIRKIYFPRLVIPLSSLIAALLDLLIGLVLLFIFCIIYKQPLSPEALFLLPAAIVLLAIAAFGLGAFLGALNVKYRDFRYALPFLLQALFFASQVIYASNLVQQTWARYFFALNPVNAAIELARSAFGAATDPAIIWIGLASAVTIAFVGVLYFKKTESYFADIV